MDRGHGNGRIAVPRRRKQRDDRDDHDDGCDEPPIRRPNPGHELGPASLMRAPVCPRASRGSAAVLSTTPGQPSDDWMREEPLPGGTRRLPGAMSETDNRMLSVYGVLSLGGGRAIARQPVLGMSALIMFRGEYSPIIEQPEQTDG